MGQELDVVVDARALQDPEYAGRGIGRLAANLLAHAREAMPALAGARLIALTDPQLPPLSPARRALFDAGRVTADTGTMRHPTWFIAPSPMTHDPLFTARLVAQPAVFAAAVVHDLIPLAFPERYLAAAGTRLAYHVSLAWLARYRLHLMNSRATAEDFSRLFRFPADRRVVFGAPLDPVFEDRGEGPRRRHVLVAGGADPRKNVACALKAHAASRALHAAGIPLVVTGRYPPADAAALAAVYEAAGGPRSLLSFAGAVSDTDLARLYREALVLVCPSQAEGFSLPVIEAMAAGAPVLASAIPPHAELIGDSAPRFAPDDDAALRRLLDRLVSEPAWAGQIVADQEGKWKKFRAAAVARRFWGAIAERAPPARLAAPMLQAGRRPRIALLTPLPPDRSGCADYSAASLSELARRVELHVFTPTRAPASLGGPASVRPLSALPFVSASFDRVVAVMGNSEFHLEIFSRLLRHGGAAICHDVRLLGLYRYLLGQDRAREAAASELGRTVAAAEIEAWLADESKLPALFLGELASACAPLIFHSRPAARLAAERYGTPENFLPFALYRPWRAEALAAPARAAARARLGIAPGEILLASFGYVHASKFPQDCIWALEMLRGWKIPARLVFVGAVLGDGLGESLAPRALARRLALEPFVHFLAGYVSEASYREWLLAADLGVQLRGFGSGHVSGALADCIGAGLPSVANAELAEVLEAPSYVRRIPDPISPLLLANALADLLAEGMHANRPLAARDAYAASHDFARYAERLAAVLGLETEQADAA